MKIATVVRVNTESYELDDGDIIKCHSKPLAEVDDSVCIHNPGAKSGRLAKTSFQKVLVFVKNDDDTTRRVIMEHDGYGIPEVAKQKFWDRLEEYVQRIFNSDDTTPKEEVVRGISKAKEPVTVANFLNSIVWKNYRLKADLKPLIIAVGEDLVGGVAAGGKDKTNCINMFKFVKEWANRRIFRQFYLWGLTKKEAIECADSLLGSKKPTIESLVKNMFEFPERFGFLTEEKVANLELIFGYKTDSQRSTRKIFLRQLWSSVSSGHSFKFINRSEFNALRDGIEIEDYDTSTAAKDASTGVKSAVSTLKPIEQIEESYGIKFLEPPYFTTSNPIVRVMPMSIYTMETYVRDMLSKKIARCPAQDSWVKAEFVAFDPDLSGDQIAAVKMILQCPISVVTGGPGTGKTRIISEVIKQLNVKEYKYFATSFTGKAVARIKEVCQPMQIKASTIDRMVNKGPNKISFRFLIIDESSMVTTEHLYRLFTTFHPLGYSIVFVGDLDQLPPIGWGHIFDSLIWSQRVPIKRLTHNYRVNAALGREIITNSQKIIDHTRNLQMSHHLEFDLGSPSFCVGNGNVRLLEKILIQLRDNSCKVDDITVLTPYNDAIAEINPLFQKVFAKTLRSNETLVSKYGKRWHVGDRVMNLENCYLGDDTGVMNGQIGKIIQIIGQDLVVEFPNFGYDPNGVKFDEKTTKEVTMRDGSTKIVEETATIDTKGIQYIELTYYHTAPKQFLDALEGITPDCLEIDKHLALAYAMSIHKSQGSEYPFSIIYLPDHKANKYFLSVNMLYTAVTRAKQCAWIVYDGRAALLYALGRRSPKTRNTIEDFLKKTFADKKYSDGIDFESLDMDLYSGGGDDEVAEMNEDDYADFD